LLVLAGCVQPTQQSTTVITSSAEDCAVYAAFARAKLNWTGQAPPSEGFFPDSIGYNDEATARSGAAPQSRYHVVCPWTKLGLADPIIRVSRPYPPAFTLMQPRYSGNRATFSYALSHHDARDGKHQVNNTNGECTLEKVDGRWTNVRCEDTTGKGYVIPYRGD
jgi:hypothetical protein